MCGTVGILMRHWKHAKEDYGAALWNSTAINLRRGDRCNLALTLNLSVAASLGLVARPPLSASAQKLYDEADTYYMRSMAIKSSRTGYNSVNQLHARRTPTL